MYIMLYSNEYAIHNSACIEWNLQLKKFEKSEKFDFPFVAYFEKICCAWVQILAWQSVVSVWWACSSSASMDIELAPASPGSSSSSRPDTPGSSRLSKRKSSFKPKSPSSAYKRKNPRWEGQTNVPVFDLLPDELVLRIHTYLDVPTIGLTAQLSTRFNEVCNANIRYYLCSIFSITI